MRITTVIPAYNAARLLPETLASVAAQTHAPDEVIVVDDGSRDDTAAVARAHGARVISIANGGVSAARNLGITEAKTEWVALLDADDLWRPDKLEKQVAALAFAPDVSLVSCDHYQFFDDGSIHRASFLADRRERYERVAPRRLAPALSRLSDMGIGLMALGMALFPSTLLLRRELALAVGGFDTGVRYAEDYEFLLRLLTRTDVLMVEEPLMGYRRHAGSVSNNDEAMANALVALGERIQTRPQDYAAGAQQAFAPRLRESAMHAAKVAFKRNDLGRSRQLLRTAGRIRRDRAWLGWSVASSLPPALVGMLFALKRGGRESA